MEVGEALGVEQKSVDDAKELVPRGPFYRPGRRKQFIPVEDLLHPDGPVAEEVAQLLEVGGGISEAIDVVHADTIDEVSIGELPEQGMGRR
ncbi:MAG: hypothetical protein KC482_10885, partial [Dehalococcoidia bacterium]|nr:hypothetical protein [Dehalococcoidia bacterium]